MHLNSPLYPTQPAMPSQASTEKENLKSK